MAFIQWGHLIPEEFHRTSGLSSHLFQVSFPTWYPTIPEPEPPTGFLLTIRRNMGEIQATITRQRHPSVFEALLLLCSVDDETVREQRYLTVASAYEAVRAPLDIDAAAIRHTIAHAPGVLRDPRIVASLVGRFGTTHPDWRLRKHRKEFFRCLASMLIGIDKTIAAEIKNDG